MDIHSTCPIGHIRPFCALATRLVRGQETIIVTLIVSPHELNKTKTEVSHLFVDEPSDASKALERIRYMLKRCALYALYALYLCRLIYAGRCWISFQSPTPPHTQGCTCSCDCDCLYQVLSYLVSCSAPLPSSTPLPPLPPLVPAFSFSKSWIEI